MLCAVLSIGVNGRGRQAQTPRSFLEQLEWGSVYCFHYLMQDIQVNQFISRCILHDTLPVDVQLSSH